MTNNIEITEHNGGPSKTEKTKLVQALAAYILTDGAKIGRQQKAYDRYMKIFLSLEAKYPALDFRSEDSQNALRAAATSKARKKLLRGPGTTV